MAARFRPGMQPEFPVHCIGTTKLSNLIESNRIIKELFIIIIIYFNFQLRSSTVTFSLVFSSFRVVYLFVALLKATYAENSYIVLSCRY